MYLFFHESFFFSCAIYQVFPQEERCNLLIFVYAVDEPNVYAILQHSFATVGTCIFCTNSILRLPTFVSHKAEINPGFSGGFVYIRGQQSTARHAKSYGPQLLYNLW